MAESQGTSATPGGSEAIRIAIVEDDPEIRAALGLLIGGTPGYHVAAAWERVEAALPEIVAVAPQVLLLDIGLPGISGLDAIAAFRGAVPSLEILMLTIREDDEAIFNALRAGASGYLIKTTAPRRILDAIAEVRAGGAPMSPGIARRVAESFRLATASPLSPRESEILALLCEGKSYKMIAAALYVSQETVHSHLKSIYRKLEVNSKSEAVARAIRERLV